VLRRRWRFPSCRLCRGRFWWALVASGERGGTYSSIITSDLGVACARIYAVLRNQPAFQYYLTDSLVHLEHERAHIHIQVIPCADSAEHGIDDPECRLVRGDKAS
jgi:hypothetical protein